LERKKKKNQIWNDCLVDLVSLAKSHLELYKLVEFEAAIRQYQEKSPKIYQVSKLLCDLFVICRLERDMGSFRDNDFINSEQATMVRNLMRELCAQIRPLAVPIVDSFNKPDFILDAPIARYDGDIYPNYFDRVKRAPGHSNNGVPSYFEKLIKPLTNA